MGIPWYNGKTGTRLTLYGIYQYEPKLFEGALFPVGINKENLVGHIMQELGELYPYHQNADWLRTNIALWSQRHLEDWQRMYNALYSDYNPIENYDRNEWEKQHDANSGNDILTNGGTDTVTDSGTDTVSNSGSDITTLGGQDKTVGQEIDDDKNVQTPNLTRETNVSAFDADNYQPRDQVNDTGTDTTQRNRQLDTASTVNYGKTDTLQHGKVEKTDHGKVETTKHGKTENTEFGHILDMERWMRAHGNIGVTTTQEMITQEMELRLTYNIYNIITYAFEKEFLVQVY